MKNLIHEQLKVHAPNVRSFGATTMDDGSQMLVFLPRADTDPNGEAVMVVRIISADGQYGWDSKYKIQVMDTVAFGQEDNHGE